MCSLSAAGRFAARSIRWLRLRDDPTEEFPLRPIHALRGLPLRVRDNEGLGVTFDSASVPPIALVALFRQDRLRHARTTSEIED